MSIHLWLGLPYTCSEIRIISLIVIKESSIGRQGEFIGKGLTVTKEQSALAMDINKI